MCTRGQEQREWPVFTSIVTLLYFAFISPSSLPVIAAVDYITHQICYHLQPTIALAHSLSSPCRLTTNLLQERDTDRNKCLCVLIMKGVASGHEDVGFSVF